ncbi:50S ribosomal protein L16 3-hydroxylase [Comamonas sp. PE63]|uniref:Cupin 4 family protein n=4 Tax=root TaxID=1 RepID=B7X5U9_COMTK|nr:MULTISPECIES: cupin domain-containing protein [Comamonas]AIJ45416.1 cupin [Comamonas testosteroni TK102]EED68911.1 Cupin 4 family protein [Comamonas testosteroni KF-1]MBS3019821.1 50S ribosomal protein L16 3-hydroxylase [Comamonas sp. PE63]MPS88592.1 cupin domain-containing protein [Comamonas sp.]NIF83808.1 cupin domain-containing protein [Comamonas sp. Tr-654]
MDINTPLTLLGGLTASQFMRKHWHKKPLLVRQAIPGFKAPIPRARLLAMAGEEGVESRLIQQLEGDNWKLSHGPLSRRSLPALTKPGWTVLVQGVDMHDAKAHELLQQFRFVPEARLDDLMISFATDQGGVGPHFDSYDVFLLQAHGKRRWRIGRQKDLSLQPGKPLKVLSHFEPEEEFVLEPGDMLYLPPKWAHDGVAEGECMTYSIGFRSPDRSELGRELLLRMSDEPDEPETPVIYRDPKQEAVSNPALIPEAMYDFAREALKKAMAEPLALERALGEYLSDPKPNVWFEHGDENGMFESVVLDRRTRMMYDAKHIFINGESYLAGGRDATLMRKLADTRALSRKDLATASDDALELLSSWFDAGWVRSGD